MLRRSRYVNQSASQGYLKPYQGVKETITHDTCKGRKEDFIQGEATTMGF